MKFTQFYSRIDFNSIIFWLSYITIVLTYSIFFSHADLNHTVISSYAIITGHINDFYEFNKIKMGGNDYLPLIYWVFAIWNLPFCSFLIECDSSLILSASELLVQKVFLGVLFAYSVRIVYLIAREVTESKEAISNVTIFYATSTVMLFCIFAFNQYDIVGIILSLYGILFYVRNKLFKFSLLFSAAISIKYFAIIAFIPILFVREKRASRIILYCLIAAGLTCIQVFFYRDSPTFMASFYSLALKKSSSGSGTTEIMSALGFIAGYSIIVILCWFSKPKNPSAEFKMCIAASISAYLLVYLKVDWHPQWISIIIPYIAFSLLYSKNNVITALFQLIFGVSYLLLVISRYANNLDSLMLGSGFFKDFFGNSHIAIVSIYKFVDFSFVNFCFYASILYFILNVIASKKTSSKGVNYPLQTAVIWISNLVFILPALYIGLSLPENLSKFDTSADLRNKYTIRTLNGSSSGKYLGNLKKGSKIDEFFYPKMPNLTAISLIFGTYHQVANNLVRLDIYSEKENIYSTLLDFSKIYPNSLTTIKNINAGNRCNRGCLITINVISGELPLEIWYETSLKEPESKYFYFNKSKINGTFIIEEFYKK